MAASETGDSVPEKAAATEADVPKSASSDFMESSSYLVSSSDPIKVTSQLGVSESKLIGGNIAGILRIESSDHERGFLAEAGNTFRFPLMERGLMSTVVDNMLQCAKDLALKVMRTSTPMIYPQHHLQRQLRHPHHLVQLLTLVPVNSIIK